MKTYRKIIWLLNILILMSFLFAGLCKADQQQKTDKAKLIYSDPWLISLDDISPDGHKLLLGRIDPNGNSNIGIYNSQTKTNLWIYNLQTKTLFQLTHEISPCYEGRWLGKDKIIYEAGPEGAIKLISDQGGTPKIIDEGMNVNRNFGYRGLSSCPCGKKIIASARKFRDQSFDLYTLNVTTKKWKLLYSLQPLSFWKANCSPDGKKIVAITLTPLAKEYSYPYDFLLNVLTLKNMKLHVFKNAGASDSPRFSPNSKWIVYVGYIPQKNRTVSGPDLPSIYLFSLTKKIPIQVTKPGRMTSPIFTPDGKKIIFQNGKDIYSIDISNIIKKEIK